METYEDHAASMVLDCSAYMAVGDLKYFDTIYYWLEVLNGNQETPSPNASAEVALNMSSNTQAEIILNACINTLAELPWAPALELAEYWMKGLES